MHSLLDYDIAFIRILRDNSPQLVRFPGDPGPVFEALADARLPQMPPPPVWELEILPDAVTQAAFPASATGS